VPKERAISLWKRTITLTQSSISRKMATMIAWSVIRRHVYVNLLRWRIKLRHMEPVYKALSIVVLALIIIAIALWTHFGTAASLPVLADMMPILLAIAGIILSYVPPKKETHIFTTMLLIVFGLAGSAVMTTARLRSEGDHRREVKGLNDKLDAVGTQNTHLANVLLGAKGTVTEAQRRAGIETTLRNKYILSHDPIDPEILAGNKMPPAAWVNDQLKSLGEEWTVSPEKSNTTPTAPIRSYLIFEDNPRFAGSAGAVPGAVAIEGANYRVGDPLGFNVHYKANGPNEIQLIGGASMLLIEPDSTPETQKSAISFFLHESSSEHRKWLKENPKASVFRTTLMPGEAQFVTAFAWTGNPDKKWVTTEDDLDKLKTGAEIAIVMTVLSYKEGGILHHLRRCLRLQPPAQPPGVWALCEGFASSD
jgi:hypothetical protein